MLNLTLTNVKNMHYILCSGLKKLIITAVVLINLKRRKYMLKIINIVYNFNFIFMKNQGKFNVILIHINRLFCEIQFIQIPEDNQAIVILCRSIVDISIANIKHYNVRRIL